MFGAEATFTFVGAAFVAATVAVGATDAADAVGLGAAAPPHAAAMIPNIVPSAMNLRILPVPPHRYALSLRFDP